MRYLSLAFLIGMCLGCYNAPTTEMADFDHLRNEGYVAFVVNETKHETPDTTPQPHPDADKCACKGTGIITHGDGHTTPCPYHEKEDEEEGERKWRCQCDTKRTYCNCKNAHGQCDCKKK